MTVKFLGRWAARFEQFVCGAVTGHSYLFHYRDNMIRMRCENCGHLTTGLQGSKRQPVRRFDGDPERHRLPKGES